MLFRRFLDQPELVREVRQLLLAMSDETGLLNRSPLPQWEELASGDRLGAYRIEELLGRGGMGAVYRATRVDDAFTKTVAIKIMSTGLGLEAFRRERQILATLEHPNIVRLLDGGTTPHGTPYLVMEFVAGGRKLTDPQTLSTISLRQRIQQFAKICEGVEYLHRNLIVHRDLKPANILVTADDTPKLLDFGISKILLEEATSAADDATRTVGFTPRYASPEQILQQPVTTSSDIYSMGVILYELLTNGGYPYETTGSGEAHVYLEAALKAEARAPGVNPDLDAITLKAIARDPANRYRSAAELREDLERYLGSLPVRARAGGWTYGLRKFVVRKKALVAAFGLAAIVAAGGVWGVLREARIANEQKLAAERAAHALRASTAEQTRLRDEAEKQRNRAEDQLDRARSLVSTMLFEIHDSMVFLQGSADAKNKIIRTSLRQLEELTKEAEGSKRSTDLQLLLLRAYERAGDLANGIPGEEGASPEQALVYYQRTLALNENLPAALRMASAKVCGIQARMALALQRLGRTEESWNRITQALRLLPVVPAAEQITLEYREHEARILISACQISTSQSRPEVSGFCLRAAQAVNSFGLSGTGPRVAEGMGEIYKLQAFEAAKRKELAAALSLIRASTASFAACLKSSPKDSNCQQGLAIAGTYISLWLEQSNDPDAERVHRDALESFRAIEKHSPNLSNVQLGRASVEKGLALVLYRSKRPAVMSEARQLYVASLHRLQSIFSVFPIGPHAKNEYAFQLLNSPWPDLRNNAEALQRAGEAVTGLQRHPAALDTLASAQFAVGQPAEARKTAEEALQRAANLKDKRLVDEIGRTIRKISEAP
jgi:tetratricopeptide (TPR) repeat protein